MMNILERYIGRSILMGTVVVMVVLLTLLGVFELMKNLDDVGVGSYTSLDAFIASLLTLPRRMFEIFPVAALVGSLLGLGLLANTGELTAMRSAGVSINALIIAVLKTGLLMLVFVFVIGEFVGPVSEAYVQKVELEKKQQKITLKSQNGFWARDGGEFINIRTILPGSELRDIYIYRVEPDKRITLSTYAKSARYIDGKWQLQGILQTAIDTAQTRSRAIENASWSSMIDPDLLSVIVVEPNMLTAKGLYNYMSFMNANGQDATRYEVAFWNKIFTPLTTVVMLVLSIPFVLGSLRESSVGHRVFIGTLIGTVFFVAKDTVAHLSLVYSFDPLLASTLPALIMAFAGYYLIRRVSRA
jgi:lipopolysaccharide export system permease protein